MSVTDAQSVLDQDVIGPDDVAHVFGAAPTVAMPFARELLITARRLGAMLVLRAARGAGDAPLTILRMLELHAQAFDPKLLRGAGYQLKDEWGIALEPLAATDTCTPGWALVRKDVLEDSCNLSYDEQDAAIQRFAALLGAPVRRRTAVEIVYDSVLYSATRQVRLLEQSWDWSSSRTVDGGYLNAGGFGPTGMQILAFSRAVRHGRLGVCPTYQPTR